MLHLLIHSNPGNKAQAFSRNPRETSLLHHISDFISSPLCLSPGATSHPDQHQEPPSVGQAHWAWGTLCWLVQGWHCCLSSSISSQFCNILQRNLQCPGLVQMSLTEHVFLWWSTQSLKPPPVANCTSLRNIWVTEELETCMCTYTSPTTTNQLPHSHTSMKSLQLFPTAIFQISILPQFIIRISSL